MSEPSDKPGTCHDPGCRKHHYLEPSDKPDLRAAAQRARVEFSTGSFRRRATYGAQLPPAEAQLARDQECALEVTIDALADECDRLRRERDEARSVAESVVTGEGGSLTANCPWKRKEIGK